MKPVPMTAAFAAEISTWTYPDEYGIYSFEASEELTKELLSGDYIACVDAEGQLLGYFCYGVAARIPTVEADVYKGNFLDIGLGLRPELCGKGFGAEFMALGINHAGAAPLRLSVAAFNRRAIKVYERCGFSKVRTMIHKFSKSEFYLMTR